MLKTQLPYITMRVYVSCSAAMVMVDLYTEVFLSPMSNQMPGYFLSLQLFHESEVPVFGVPPICRP